MMKEFNRYNLSKPYSYYQCRYNMLITQINVLSYSIEKDSKYYISIDAKRVIEETFQLDGYIECLFDLGIISESDYDKFYDFTKEIRYNSNEILLYLDFTN